MAGLVRHILECGVSARMRNHLGCTALHVFFEQGNGYAHPPHDFLALILDQGPRIVDLQDEEGFTALHLASLMSEVSVDRLIKADADFNLMTAAGENALHLACRARKADIVALLLHHSVSKEATNSSGRRCGSNWRFHKQSEISNSAKQAPALRSCSVTTYADSALADHPRRRILPDRQFKPVNGGQPSAIVPRLISRKHHERTVYLTHDKPL